MHVLLISLPHIIKEIYYWVQNQLLQDVFCVLAIEISILFYPDLNREFRDGEITYQKLSNHS